MTSDLGAAWTEVEAALPYKRWGVTLTGDWEDGWVATAWSSLVAGQKHIEAASAEDHWGYTTIGTDTPAAALRALALKLRER